MSGLLSTATLLIQGSDSRQRLDPHSGVNHYLCRPRPDPDILKLGSSTATTISQCGFDIADEMRNRMADTCRNRPPESVFREQARRICRELRDCLELNESTSIELTESGTDTHRRAVCSVLARAKQEELLVLMVEAAETGRGVPEALRAASSVVDGGRVRCHEIAIRDTDGAPLPVAAVDAAVTAQAEQAMQGGEHLLLVMVDQSKSGCVAPSLSCGLDLQKRYPGRIHLLLDGCQFRFSARTLNRYLEHGVMVAITGSKFLAGPSFSGALLWPNSEPVTMPATDPGLLIRWQVALEALRELSMLNDRKICEFLERCGQAIGQRLTQDPVFEPLATPAIIRQKTDSLTRWDDLPTIFPFRLRLHSARGEPSTYASYNDAMTIYRTLQQGDAPRVQLGRPILAGRNRKGQPNGALRLCISAPMLTDAIARQQQSSIIAQCMLALDRISTDLEAWHEHFDS